MLELNLSTAKLKQIKQIHLQPAAATSEKIVHLKLPHFGAHVMKQTLSG